MFMGFSVWEELISNQVDLLSGASGGLVGGKDREGVIGKKKTLTTLARIKRKKSLTPLEHAPSNPRTSHQAMPFKSPITSQQ